MPQLCPHCGVSLPSAGDAFCPECRQALDEPAAELASPLEDREPSPGCSDIAGAEGLRWDELAEEIERGARLVIYRYCISIGILTFLRASKVHSIRGGESAALKGMPYTMLSLVAGWWGSRGDSFTRPSRWARTCLAAET